MGGQAALAILTYQAFTKALSRIMESPSVTSETFEATTLHDNTIFGVLKDDERLSQDWRYSY